MIKRFQNSPRKNIYLLFFFLVFLFYGNSLRNKYALDDNFVTVTNAPERGMEKAYKPDNELVAQGIKGIPKIWKSRYAHDGEGSFDYRPLVTTTYAIEYSIFGQNPFISHLLNLLLYFLCVCVVYKTILALFSAQSYKESLAFICAFIFLIHPLHTEAVDNIKSRDELLSFIFSMLALIYSFRTFDKFNAKDLLLTALFLLLGMFSKRTSILAFIVIPMSLYFFRSVNAKKILISLGALLVVYALFGITKKSVLSEVEVRNFYHFENAMYVDHPSLIGKVLIALKTLGIYIKLLIFPFPMRFYYGEKVFDLSAGFDVFSAVALAFVGLCTWYYLKTKNKYFLYAVLLFLGSIAPFLNFFTPVAGVLGDRLAFNASFGFCLLASIALLPYFEKISFRKPSFALFTSKPMVYLSVTGVICLIYVIGRNSNWYDRMTLFQHDIVYMEESSKGNSLLANEYYEKMNRSKSEGEARINAENALKHYKLAIKADSSMFSACNNAGVVLFSFYKDYPEAVRYFRLATEAKPGYAQAFENLGNSYRMMTKTDSAMIFYNKAIESNPKQYASYDDIAMMYGDAKDYKHAAEAYDRALKVFPNEYYFTTQKANYIFMDGREAEGLLLFEEAFKLSPNDKLGAFLVQKFTQANNKDKAAYYQNYHY